jgi:hypothetical protein
MDVHTIRPAAPAVKPYLASEGLSLPHKIACGIVAAELGNDAIQGL